ncbi:MAG: TetR/AcrR family transcriptional regulator [Bacteroidales bacterium]|jgi:AcrR family transcriptional regulator|nr:TetR/AcrR family transcriptional regulator [Bacteroidales bacterium]
MELRQRIIEVSSDLFMSNGCKSVTMDEVAAANGISKRTLYEHFKDKTNLLEECLIMMEAKMIEVGERAFNGSKSILELVCIEHESQTDMMVNMRIRFFDELKKYYPALYNKMYSRFTDYHKVTTRKFLERGQQEGLFLKNIDMELVGKMVFQIASMIQDSEIFSLANHSRKQLFRESMVMYFRGISTEEGIKMIDKYLNIKE